MKNIPIPVARSGMGRRLPTPEIKTAVVRQAVDLKPAGATVAITTISDNPFEGKRPVRIITQASGGMASAGAPSPRPSGGIMHSFLPGLGETNTAEVAEQPQSWGQTAQSLLTSAVDTAVTREERKRAEQEARIAEAQSRQSMAQRAGSAVRRGVSATSIDLFGMKVNLPLLLVGAGLLTFVVIKRKKSKSKK